MKFMMMIALACLAAAPLLTGCGTLSDDLSSGASLTDKQITDDIQNRLFNDTVTRSTPIGITVVNGVATVRGVVHNETMRGRVLGIVRGAPGVTEVVDNLDIR